MKTNKSKMTQKQLKEIFNISPSTFHDWFSNPNHSKHILALYIADLEYEDTKQKIEKLKSDK